LNKKNSTQPKKNKRSTKSAAQVQSMKMMKIQSNFLTKKMIMMTKMKRKIVFPTMKIIITMKLKLRSCTTLLKREGTQRKPELTSLKIIISAVYRALSSKSMMMVSGPVMMKLSLQYKMLKLL
jgi:hypothetical protein